MLSGSKLTTLLSLAIALVGIVTAVDWAHFAAAPWPAKLGILGALIGSIGAALGKALGAPNEEG